MALLTLENLSFSYPNTDRQALCDISLSVEKGAFVTVMGATGSGKSTLLRLLKPALRQNGAIEGKITYDGADIDTIDAGVIGYVAQQPQEQIVTDKVWHELAFTLENSGAKRDLIARRIAETAAFFDMDSLMERDTATLSGGEQQLVNLAAVMTADPALLLLDEPTAQLDPVTAARFIEAVVRLNRECGVTVLMVEHRAEALFPVSDQLVILDGGRIACSGTPQAVARQIGADSPLAAFLPTAARIYHAVGGQGDLPLSIREGQRFIHSYDNNIRSLDETDTNIPTEEALSLRQVYFRYERHGADILRDLELTVYRGEVFALLGANGAGKSTAAAVIAGLRKPYCGMVKLFQQPLKSYKNGTLYRENLSLLPQDTESVFLHETVREELKGCDGVLSRLPYDLTPLFDRHPYDLSGGERQLVALCKALASHPRFLIMDEPSKGLDNRAKDLLCEVIAQLKKDGVTILLITHDVEFAALCADRCTLFAQGRIAAVDTTQRFMSDNRFYTTAAARITRSHYDGAYTAEKAAALIRRNGGAL